MTVAATSNTPAMGGACAMLFSVEHDTGDTITGYVVPDDADSSAAIRVLAEGATLWTGLADDPRPALVAAGRHATGRAARLPSQRHPGDRAARAAP
jgi:hypothetical protein